MIYWLLWLLDDLLANLTVYTLTWQFTLTNLTAYTLTWQFTLTNLTVYPNKLDGLP